MPTPDELEIIKPRWEEENRYRMVELEPYQLFDKAQKDIRYLLNRLEAAERAARQFARASGKFTFTDAVGGCGCKATTERKA